MKIILTATAAHAVAVRPASTTLVLRDGPAGRVEVLMVRRSMQASFMPGAYVFPGGAVDPADAETATGGRADESAAALEARIGRVTGTGAHAPAFAVAALRECFEECGLWLGAGPGEAESVMPLRPRLHAGEPLAALAAAAGVKLATSALQPWAHWITPLGNPKRFDTLFFVARAPEGQTPEVDASETTTLSWVEPGAALAACRRGEFQMEFATVRVVETLVPFETQGTAAMLGHAAGARELPVVLPRFVVGAERRMKGILLPGDAGYDEAVLTD